MRKRLWVPFAAYGILAGLAVLLLSGKLLLAILILLAGLAARTAIAYRAGW